VSLWARNVAATFFCSASSTDEFASMRQLFSVTVRANLMKEGETVFVSRLAFHTLPGKTQMVEDKLQQLVQWVGQAGGQRARVMRTHYGSPGAPDLIFEQEEPGDT
jgi:hypothetical protein